MMKLASLALLGSLMLTPALADSRTVNGDWMEFETNGLCALGTYGLPNNQAELPENQIGLVFVGHPTYINLFLYPPSSMKNPKDFRKAKFQFADGQNFIVPLIYQADLNQYIVGITRPQTKLLFSETVSSPDSNLIFRIGFGDSSYIFSSTGGYDSFMLYANCFEEISN